MARDVILGLLAATLGALGAFLVSRFGRRLGLIDRPTPRSSHTRETPKGGGIGITAAFLVTAVVLGFPVAFWLPLAVLSGLALRGDQVEISPRLRLPAQFILAGVLVVGTGAGAFRDLPGGWLSLFWVVFIVGTANFFNFMDGINGIAGISGAVGFGLLAFATHRGQPEAALLAACLALACVGFLPFNLPRARVFMGDAGSILLGAAFAGLVCLTSRSWVDLLCRAAFLFPFYCDELTTMAVRLRAGEDLTRPHRRHVYQLLANELRLPHGRVAAAYGLAQLLVGTCALWARTSGTRVLLAVLAGWFALFALGGYVIRKRARAGKKIEGT